MSLKLLDFIHERLSQTEMREATTSHQKSVRVTIRVMQKVVNKAAYQKEEKHIR